MSQDLDALQYAYRIAELFPISKEVAERLTNRVAMAGWYGRLEAYAKRYANRAPTSEEVAMLFKSYLHGASYGDSTEKALATYAKKFMSPEDAEVQMTLIAERNERAKMDIY